MKKFFKYIILLILCINTLFLFASCKDHQQNGEVEKELFFLENTTKYYAPVIAGVLIDKIIIPAFTKDNFTMEGDPLLIDVQGENISGLDFSLKKYPLMGAVSNPNDKSEIYDIYHFDLGVITNNAYCFSEDERSVNSIRISYVDKEYDVPLDVTLTDYTYSESAGNNYSATNGESLCYDSAYDTIPLRLGWSPDAYDYATGGYCTLKNVYFVNDVFDIEVVEFQMKNFYNHPREVDFYYLSIDSLENMNYQHSNETHIVESRLNQKDNIPYAGDCLKIEFQPYDYDNPIEIIKRMYTKMDVILMQQMLQDYLSENS